MQSHKSILVIVVFFVLIVATDSFAGKRDKPRLPTGPSNIIDIRLNLVPFLTVGTVVGEAAEQIDRYDGSSVDKLLYGGGISLSYYPQPRYAVALNLAYLYKKLPGDDVPAGRGWMYSGGFIFNLRTQVKYVTYMRADIGFVSAKWPRTGDDLKLGTHPYVRLGLGVFTFTSGSVNTRVEAYYSYAFSEGHSVEDWVVSEIPYNAQCFGVEFGVGFPISRR